MAKTILIVDDELSFTKMLKINLEQTGKYKVETENKGLSALGAAKRCKPDLIILDVMMPGIDGGMVAFQLKEDAQTKNIPIVFLTAAITEEESASKGGAIGGRPFIAKPVALETLIAFIEKHIRK